MARYIPTISGIKYTPTRRVRNYYKPYENGYENSLGVFSTNTATISSDFIASGFSTTAYLDVDKAYKSTNNSEYVIKFTTPSSWPTSTLSIIHCEKLFCLDLLTNGTIADWNFGTSARCNVVQLAVNTTYRFKVAIQGTTRTIYNSTDGSTWNQLISFTDTGMQTTYDSFICIGNFSSGTTRNRPYSGTIDLKETYINIGGKRVWNAVEAKISKEEADSNPDSYYRDVVQKYTPARRERKYYKYATRYLKYVWGNWTQPSLSANGTVGGSSFACNASAFAVNNNPSVCVGIYGAFDTDASTYWRSGTTTGWIGFYSPEPLKVSKLVFGYFYSYITGGNVQASNDNSSWTTVTSFTNSAEADLTINVNSTTAYKYWRVNITGVNKDVIHCNRLSITATYNTGNVIESTSSDYDYTEQYGAIATPSDYDYYEDII